jgi:homogentisate 1,2-dioxygenase
MFAKGRITRQAHVDLPEGTFEEEYAREGFSGRYAHLYRSRPPVDWTRIEGPLRPHALRLLDLGRPNGDYLTHRVAFLRNEDVELSLASLGDPMPYHFRNADGDDLLFVHTGHGRLETDFGPLDYEPGDYLLIPRGTIYRLSPRSDTRLLVIQTRGEVTVPDRGLLGQHALFDPAVMETPEPDPNPVVIDPDREWELKVKQGGEITSFFFHHSPITTVGWKGNLTVAKINVRDIRPVMSERYHLPPTAHATFVADQVVVASFLPRGLETGDPGALRVPFYHSNIDYDEVLFYHAGEFFSRAGIEPGMVTFHPQGLPHGPHPKAIERSRSAVRTEEQAVMVDTRRPLELTDAAKSVEWTDYWRSWSTEAASAPSQSGELVG